MANSKGIKSLKLVGRPGGIVQPGITKYGVWDWVETAIDYGKKGYEWYKENKDLADTIAKTATSLGKGYLDYRDAKRRNELEERAYEDYMKEAEAAGYEAQAAIDLNLTPMTITNIPTTKADITDYTAATGLKHGGISGLRKGYASRGFVDDDEVLEMDEEVITPYDLQKEEGVNIGKQVFYNTGRGDRANAMMIWDQMSVPDKSIFDFDFEIFFNDGGWRDMIKGEAPGAQENMEMASAPSMGDSQNDMSMQLFNKPYNELNEMELEMFNEEMLRLQSKFMAKGGIANLRKKYSMGTPDTDVEIMDEESLGDFELKQEEGVNIGPMAGPDWYIKRVEHLEFLGYSYDEASEIAFDDDKYYSIVGMESAVPRGGDPEQTPIHLPKPGEEPMKMAAKGGRIKKANGGIMDMGGLEKDYRFSGGFVPIGEYERKDDVPARLSKNEFVFTADAVRAAGGGSINKGAKRMYNVMKNLEAKPEAKRMTA